MFLQSLLGLLLHQVLTMKVLLVLTIATLATANPQGGQPTQGGKIVGGEEAPEREHHNQRHFKNY